MPGCPTGTESHNVAGESGRARPQGLKMSSVGSGGHQPHGVPERLKCGRSELTCVLNVKYTLNFKDLVWKKKKDVKLLINNCLY